MSTITVIHSFALLIGFGTGLIGVMAVLRPQLMTKAFGIPATDSTLPYVVSTGIRDVFMGAAVFVLFFTEQWASLGVIQFCLGLVAICDFTMVRRHGDRKTSYVHMAGAIVVIAYGLVLLLVK